MTPAQRRSAASRKAARSRKRIISARREAEACQAKGSKKDKIIDLLALGHSRQEAADAVGCGTAYVRAVIARVANPERDAAYQRALYWGNAEFRKTKLAKDRERRRRARDRAESRA